MASKAKRYRNKLVREGKMDPSLKRGSWYGVNPIERKPEQPEVEKRRKEMKHKRRLFRGHESDVSFYLKKLQVIRNPFLHGSVIVYRFL